jgi:hypothetical protein
MVILIRKFIHLRVTDSTPDVTQERVSDRTALNLRAVSFNDSGDLSSAHWAEITDSCSAFLTYENMATRKNDHIYRTLKTYLANKGFIYGGSCKFLVVMMMVTMAVRLAFLVFTNRKCLTLLSRSVSRGQSPATCGSRTRTAPTPQP